MATVEVRVGEDAGRRDLASDGDVARGVRYVQKLWQDGGGEELGANLVLPTGPAHVHRLEAR